VQYLPLVGALGNEEGQDDPDDGPEDSEHDDRGYSGAHFDAKSTRNSAKTGFKSVIGTLSYDLLLLRSPTRVVAFTECAALPTDGATVQSD
jgi:hypothetical protein